MGIGYNEIGGAAVDSAHHLAMTEIGVGEVTYHTLTAFERAGVLFGATIVLAMAALGVLQGFAPRTVAKSRRSPLISICIGIPSLLVLGMLAGIGYLLVGTSLGTFFGIIFAIVGITVVPISTVLGFVAVGQSVAARLGYDHLWAGVVVGGLLSGLVGLAPAATVVAIAVSTVLGLGAGIRIVLGQGEVTRPDERTVPPANRV